MIDRKRFQGLLADVDANAVMAYNQSQQGPQDQSTKLDGRYVVRINKAKLDTDRYPNGLFRLRLLPSTPNSKTPQKSPVLTRWEYKLRYIHDSMENVSCRRTEGINEDPIQQLQRELYKRGDERARTMAKDLYPRAVHNFWCIMRLAELVNPVDGTKGWYVNVGPRVGHLPEKIGQTVLMTDPEGQRIVPCVVNSDIIDGHDLLINCQLVKPEGTGATYPKYDGTLFSSHASLLSDDENDIMGWLEEVDRMEANGEGLWKEYSDRLVSDDKLQQYADLIRQIYLGKASSGKLARAMGGADDEVGEAGEVDDMPYDEPPAPAPAPAATRQAPRPQQSAPPAGAYREPAPQAARQVRQAEPLPVDDSVEEYDPADEYVDPRFDPPPVSGRQFTPPPAAAVVDQGEYPYEDQAPGEEEELPPPPPRQPRQATTPTPAQAPRPAGRPAPKPAGPPENTNIPFDQPPRKSRTVPAAETTSAHAASDSANAQDQDAWNAEFDEQTRQMGRDVAERRAAAARARQQS